MYGLAAIVVLGIIIILALKLRFSFWLKRKSRRDLEEMVFHFDTAYFGFIGPDHADVLELKDMIARRDLPALRKNWSRLSRSFQQLERKAGHQGRPLILDYYNWYEMAMKELARRDG